MRRPGKRVFTFTCHRWLPCLFKAIWEKGPSSEFKCH